MDLVTSEVGVSTIGKYLNLVNTDPEDIPIDTLMLTIFQGKVRFLSDSLIWTHRLKRQQ
jgi:hypothetical protein